MKRLILLAIALMMLTACAKSEQTYPIVDKYEHNGKCYLAIEVEISPEEYIGYDIGDEYRTN